MAEKKQDVRVTKTQRSLVQALMALLEKQNFAQITINDICNEAMVSRSTFYAHFEDKYQLLRSCMEALDDRIFADVENMDFRDRLILILNNMQRHEKQLRNLMLAELDIELLEMFRQRFIERFSMMLEAHGLGDEIPAAQLEVVASFYAAGVSQTTMLWIAKKLPISAEGMADVLCVLLDGLQRKHPSLPHKNHETEKCIDEYATGEKTETQV